MPTSPPFAPAPSGAGTGKSAQAVRAGTYPESQARLNAWEIARIRSLDDLQTILEPMGPEANPVIIRTAAPRDCCA
jgi:hypothetical protein